MNELCYGLTLREDPLARRVWWITKRQEGEKNLYESLRLLAEDLGLEERPDIYIDEEGREFVSRFRGEWPTTFDLLYRMPPMYWGAYMYIISTSHRALLPDRPLAYDEDNWRLGLDWKEDLDRRAAHGIFNFARAGALFYSRGLITTVPGWYYYCVALHEDAWLVARQAIKTVDQKLVEMIEESRENAAEGGAEW